MKRAAGLLLVGAVAFPGLGQPLFRDAAEAWGLTKPIVYGETNGPEKTLLETTGTGVAVIDYDNDGRPDLFFVNGSRLSGSHARSMLYHNAGGRFEDVSSRAGFVQSGWGQGACTGDYDNDGWTDLYVTYHGFNALHRNRGDGTFEEVAQRAHAVGAKPAWSTGCAFLDYDRDGDLDLMVARYAGFRDPATGSAAERCSWRGMQVICGPLGLPFEANVLYRNNGDGTFADVSQASGITTTEGHYCFQPITSDFDQDGWVDIYVACDSTANILYRNNRNGTFSDVGLVSGAALSADGNAQASMGAAVADFDGDGRPDVIVTNFSEDLPTLYRNMGNWTFSDVTLPARLGRYRQFLGWGVLFFDLDLDGWEDLVMANGHVYREVDAHRLGSYKQSKLLYRNQGDGTFADITSQGGPELTRKTSSRGAAHEDFDGDGAPDVVIVNLNEPPSLLLNQRQAGNWVMLTLVGKASNRSAIGARVVLQAGRRSQTREVRSSASFCSSGGLRLHFGLGEASKIDEVRVFWPSGKQQLLNNVHANQFVKIREPET